MKLLVLSLLICLAVIDCKLVTRPKVSKAKFSSRDLVDACEGGELGTFTYEDGDRCEQAKDCAVTQTGVDIDTCCDGAVMFVYDDASTDHGIDFSDCLAARKPTAYAGNIYRQQEIEVGVRVETFDVTTGEIQCDDSGLVWTKSDTDSYVVNSDSVPESPCDDCIIDPIHAPPPLDTNLLVNPTFDAATSGAVGPWIDVDLGRPAVVDNNGQDDTSAARSFGEANPGIFQCIDVSAYAELIDTGLADVQTSFFFEPVTGGAVDPGPWHSYFSSADCNIANILSSDIQSSGANPAPPTYTMVSFTNDIPATTRSIDVRLRFASTGGDSTGLFDNVVTVITT